MSDAQAQAQAPPAAQPLPNAQAPPAPAQPLPNAQAPPAPAQPLPNVDELVDEIGGTNASESFTGIRLTLEVGWVRR